jgi:hypothetical protein
VSLTIGGQNAIKSCRWNSDFYLHAVLKVKQRRHRHRTSNALPLAFLASLFIRGGGGSVRLPQSRI